MRRYFAVFLVLLLLIPGCVSETLPLTVTLASPSDGSTVISLTPTLSWGGGSNSATYRLMVASDSNFQNLIIDANNVKDLSYKVPPTELDNDTWYYWKVLAQDSKQISSWTEPWSLHTPAEESPAGTGTVRVSATLDGKSWSGSVNYTINGPFSDTDNSVPWIFEDVPAGNYTVTYNYGGPAGASLQSITPVPNMDLKEDDTLRFVLNFSNEASSGINVNAILNGAPWSGKLSYAISGPMSNSEKSVPLSFNNLPAGKYTIMYKSGGPAGAVLSGISPSPTQKLKSGGSIVYTLNFTETTASSLSVTAIYNGVSWSGPVRFKISGPVNNTYTSIPLKLNNLPQGQYVITYLSGGPSGATLGNISPGQSIFLSSGGSAGFILNYSTQKQTGNVKVTATLDGSNWSGGVNYSLIGPSQSNNNRVPQTFNNEPVGTYNLMYLSGGPSNAVLTGITPAPEQALTNGQTIGFNLNFISQASQGTITVNATLDGKSWRTALGSGGISYSVIGPQTDSENTIPLTMNDIPSGSYTLQYNSGGPTGATLTNISPSPSQNLTSGGNIVFTLHFTGQPKGYVNVQATIDGQSWSGSVSYVVQGPYVESGSAAPQSFANAPQGTYSIQYRGGGPPGCSFTGVSPSSQVLPPGGSINFVLMFHFQGIIPPPEPGPMPGPVPEPMPGN
jgi:hypothetical protein